jgi:hypothetical protein
MHAAFVEPSRAFADCVVTEGGFNDRALRAVWRRILRLAAT